MAKATLARTKQRRRGDDQGGALADPAAMIVGGGDTISDLAMLRFTRPVFPVRWGGWLDAFGVVVGVLGASDWRVLGQPSTIC